MPQFMACDDALYCWLIEFIYAHIAESEESLETMDDIMELTDDSEPTDIGGLMAPHIPFSLLQSSTKSINVSRSTLLSGTYQ